MAVPPLTPVVGVKMAVRVRGLPVVLRAPKVPQLTSKSPVVPFQTNELPGSSLKVKVMVAVWLEIKVAMSDVTATVGRVVSTKYLALSATADEVMVALLPLASLSVAPFKLSALNAMATPLLSFCKAATVVVNTKTLVSEPDT